jgi:hypothetical protein
MAEKYEFEKVTFSSVCGMCSCFTYPYLSGIFGLRRNQGKLSHLRHFLFVRRRGDKIGTGYRRTAARFISAVRN